MSDNIHNFCLSIISHGHGTLVTKLLAQLDACSYLKGVKTILTLNKQDEIVEIPELSNLNITIVRNSQPKGFGANHNETYNKFCDTEWFIILNPDLQIIEPEPFQKILQALDINEISSDSTGLIAPMIKNSDFVIEDFRREFLSLKSIIFRRFSNKKISFTSSRKDGFFWIAGMCLMINAKAFKTVGGFDERYFLYCEDFDLSLRLYQSGYDLVIFEDEIVIHDARRQSHKDLFYLTLHFKSLIKVWTSKAFWRYALNFKG